MVEEVKIIFTGEDNLSGSLKGMKKGFADLGTAAV